MSTFHTPELGCQLKVLVVDDNLDGADSLGMLVRAWGYACQVAYSGVIGLQYAVAMPPAVVLSDIDMPGMNGYVFARSMRQQSSLDKTTLIAISGFGNNEARGLALAAGFDFHYTKPIDLVFLQKVLNAIAARQPIPDSEQRCGNATPAPSLF